MTQRPVTWSRDPKDILNEGGKSFLMQSSKHMKGSSIDRKFALRENLLMSLLTDRGLSFIGLSPQIDTLYP